MNDKRDLSKNIANIGFELFFQHEEITQQFTADQISILRTISSECQNFVSSLFFMGITPEHTDRYIDTFGSDEKVNLIDVYSRIKMLDMNKNNNSTEVTAMAAKKKFWQKKRGKSPSLCKLCRKGNHSLDKCPEMYQKFPNNVWAKKENVSATSKSDVWIALTAKKHGVEPGSWIIDSGASDHIACDPLLFS